jgi:SAM-dependent methyltransferase
LVRGGFSKNVTADDLKITDSVYGRTLDIYQCSDCNFQFCPGTSDIAGIYDGLEDAEYEDTREPRLLQAHELLKMFGAGGLEKKTLLDVGAGSGILLEAAGTLGVDARGIEPSRWLVERAHERGFNIEHGVLDSGKYSEQFDFVTVVDVIEHVEDPISLLKNARDVLSDGGRMMVVTPDRGSILARILGYSWWHYRVAHIGYFDAASLRLACERSGLEIVSEFRPKWYFTLQYILQRLKAYIPVPDFFVNNRLLHDRVVPLNLFDSLGFILRKSR